MKKSQNGKYQTGKTPPRGASHSQSADSGMEPFRQLGNAAPIFRVLLAGVEFPIKDMHDLHEKTQSDSRILKFADGDRLNGGRLKRLFSVKDILDALPELEGQMPLKSQEEMIGYIVKAETQESSQTDKPGLICRIGNDALKALLDKPKYMVSREAFDPGRQTSPYLRIDLSDYMNCRDLATAEAPEDPCQFLKSMSASENKYQEAVTYIDQLNNAYDSFMDNVHDFCSNPDPSELETLRQDRDLICDYANHEERGVKKLAVEALELMRSANCDAKYIVENWEDYEGVYFPSDQDCTNSARGTIFDASSSTFVRQTARDAVEQWADPNNELWSNPLAAYNDAEAKCSSAEELIASLEAISTIEPARLAGWIDPPWRDDPDAPEGDVVEIRLTVSNNSALFQVLDEACKESLMDEQTYVCEEGSNHFDVTGNYGPSTEGASEVALIAEIDYEHQVPDPWGSEYPITRSNTIYQLWIATIDVNSICNIVLRFSDWDEVEPERSASGFYTLPIYCARSDGDGD